jgi:hypothetical protein
VSAVNVATGELLWQHSFSAGQQLSVNHVAGLLPYQNYLVVEPDPAALMVDGTIVSVWILNATTGITEQQIGVPSKTVVAGVSHGNVIMAEDTSLLDSSGSAPASPILTAYSLSSGREVWHKNSSSCDRGQVADDTVIVVACDSAIEGLDPMDGSVIWRNHVTGGWGNWQVLYLSNGIIQARGNTSVTFLDEHGNKIITARTGTAYDGQDPVYFGVAGQNLIFASVNGQNRLALTSASLRTGKVQNHFTMPAGIRPTGVLTGIYYYPVGLSIADDAVYLQVILPDMFMGNALLEVNMADGSRLLRFAPSRLSGATGNAAPDLPASTAVAIDGSAMLVTYTSAASDGLTAFRVSPPAGQPKTNGIGASVGVPGHWPGACSLLPPTDKKILGASLGAQYRAQQITQSLGPDLPTASTCYFVSSAATSGNVTVRVAWDADTVADAKALLSRNDESTYPPVRGPWDLGYRFSNESTSDGFEMSVGTLDIMVSDTFHGIAQRFAENMANWLRSRQRGGKS